MKRQAQCKICGIARFRTDGRRNTYWHGPWHGKRIPVVIRRSGMCARCDRYGEAYWEAVNNR